MGLLGWLDSSSLSVWIREGSTVWAFPSIITFHTFGLAVLVGAAAVMNLRLLGIGGRIPMAPMRTLFQVMWAGFALNLVTGTLLFCAQATNRGTSLFFLMKMVFVTVGVLTTARLQQRVYGGNAADEVADTGSVRGLAVLSLLVWAAAVTAGRLLAYV